VTAARERYRAHDAELERMARDRDALATAEAMPDSAPGYERQRELGDDDE
jgi:hypothetical protein